MATAALVTSYLANQKKTADKDLADEWTKIEELYNESTIKFTTFVHHDSMNNKEVLYNNFISAFKTK